MPSFTSYDITIQITDRLVGGIPIVPEGADRADIYEKWAAGQNVAESARSDLADALADEPDMPVTVEDVAGLATGFRRDEQGIYIEARQVKAMLREAAQRLGIIKQVRGSRQVLQHDLHVRAADGTQKIRLRRIPEPYGYSITEPSGEDARPISVVTRQGPRTALKRFQYVTKPVITFRVLILAGGTGDNLIAEAKLREMVEFGGWLGLGADRSQGEGCYEMIRLTEVTGD